MSMSRVKDHKLFEVGNYNEAFNQVLQKPLHHKKIYQSEGLKAHILKRHPNCVHYIPKISEIIEHPDYIGTSLNEGVPSLELVKVFKENILVGIKLDVVHDYLYVSTLHNINQSKLERRLYSGRLKRFSEVIDKSKK